MGKTSVSYQQHPLSAAFPAMAPEQYQELVDSVSNVGVLNPITLFEGMVIDGWHRYRAATELGLDCPSMDLADGVDPRDFVLGQNKARRHILVGQLALATTAVYAWAPVGNPSFPQSGTECPIGKTNAQLAEIAGTSERTIKQAKKVQRDAAPEVVEAVKRGEVGLSKASKIASLPREQQAEALTKPATPTPARLTEAGQIADDDAPSLDELIDDLQRENKVLQAQVEALSSDDKAAKLATYVRMYEDAVRKQSEEMDKTKRATDREAWTKRQLMRCGKAVGEEDPTRIVAAVEAIARAAKKVPA